MVEILGSNVHLGFGTAENIDPDECTESVSSALDAGYRHIDTAQWYHNEEYVGDAIAESPVARDQVQLATKIHPGYLSENGIERTFHESLDRLGVDYVDLLYVHWPIWTYKPEETLKKFESLQRQGLIRGIGLSNFTPNLVSEAQEILDVPISALQIEFHPLLVQSDIVAFANDEDIPIVGYAPLAHGEILNHEVVRDIAATTGHSPAQITLAWCLSKETVLPIPKASGPHIEENTAASDIDLSSEDLRRIDEVGEERRIFDIEAAPWNA